MESSCMPCFFGFPIMYVSFICVVVCGCDLFIFIILRSIHSTRWTFGLFSAWALRKSTMLNFLKCVIESFRGLELVGRRVCRASTSPDKANLYSKMIEPTEQYIRAPTIIPSLTSWLLPLEYFYPMCNICIFFPLWNFFKKNTAFLKLQLYGSSH